MRETRRLAACACPVLPKLTVVIQRIVPSRRPNGSSRYRDQSCTPAIAPGCSACRSRARGPATSVAMSRWTVQTAPSAAKYPASSPAASALVHSGIPAGCPDSTSSSFARSRPVGVTEAFCGDTGPPPSTREAVPASSEGTGVPRRGRERPCRRTVGRPTGAAHLPGRTGSYGGPDATREDHDDEVRLHPDDGAERREGDRLVRDPRRGGRVRLRGLERPLLPVAHGAGPRRVRVDDARRGRPCDEPRRAGDVRHLPHDPLPPGGRGAE